ncbi:MAG: hypothetical protein FK733_15900 [Asgard group archaeon]|nr:hypothetical protein [Asgard group archaeon]
MKRMDVPSVVLMFMAILNAIAIGWIVSSRSLLTQSTFLMLLGAILIVTLTMISLGEFYEYLVMENKRLRVAIVAITRIFTFAGSVLGVIGSFFLFYSSITFSILFSRQILEFEIMFLIGMIFVPLLFVVYTVFTFIAVILMGSYQFRSLQYYRIREFAHAITNEDIMENFHENIETWALYIPDSQAVELFKSVVKEMPMATNELNIIAKPFAIIFPTLLGEFGLVAETQPRIRKDWATQLSYAIGEEMTKETENAEALKLVATLEPQRENMKLIRPLVEKKRSVPVELIIEETNLSQEQIEEVCKFIDREVFDGNILSNIQYIKKLQKVL